MRRALILLLLVSGLSIASFANAALTDDITPLSGVIDVSRWVGDETANLDAAGISGIVGVSPLFEVYKADVGVPVSEYGPLKSNIETVYDPAADPSGATITFSSSRSFDLIKYLIVKDGNQTPAWYLFDIDALGWMPGETILLSGFWPDQGAISHVALYATPIPGAAWLLGGGLLGLFAIKRRKW